MVKRPKSPEVVEDSRFFTIFLPYPLNGDWQDEAETKKLAWWIAECIGEENLWAILWKPSSAGMVLIEVSKSFTDHGRLLGEHRWVDVLKNPTDEEKQGCSRIFHCFYNAYREAQKDGWKIAAVTKDWFEDWKPGNGNFKQPYPDTYWCAVPVEDRTGKPLCRPLPMEAKSPPPQVQPPVVGSSKWVEQQAEAPPKGSSWPKKQHRPRNLSGGRGKNSHAAAPSEISSWGPPVGESPPASEAPSPAPVTPISISGDGQLPAESVPNKASNKSAWGKPVPLKKFNNEGNNQNKGTSGWSKPVQPPAPASGISPLAEPKPTGPVNAWAKPLKVTLAERIGGIAEPTTEADATNRTKLIPLGHAAAAAAAASAGGSGLPARPAIRSEPIRTGSSSRYRSRKEASEELSKMSQSAGLAVPISSLVASLKANLASRNANKRKERGEDEERSGHVVGSSLGGDKEGPWSVNPSPPRRARTEPPEGYKDTVNEGEKAKEKEVEKMDVDPPVDGGVKQEEDAVDAGVKLGEDDVKMADEDEEKQRKLLTNPVDVKMELTTEALDSALKESGDKTNPYSPSGGGGGGGGGVADSMWSSRRDENINSSGSRRKDRAPRSKPLDWGRSSRGEDRSNSGRRQGDTHWSSPRRSERDDRSHRHDARDRDSKYASSSRRDDRDKDSRYRDSGQPYRPREDKDSPTADRSGGADSSRSKREERSPDRERKRDRGDIRNDRGSRRRKEDGSPETERRERERDAKRSHKDGGRDKERGPRDARDRETGPTQQGKVEARAGRDEEMKDEVPTTNTANPSEPNGDMDKERVRESEDKEDTRTRNADMDVDPPTSRSDGSWFLRSTHVDWGAFPTDEPKASSNTKQAEDAYRPSTHRSEEEQSRAGRDEWGRDNNPSTRRGDDHHNSFRRRDDDLRSRSRRERDGGNRSDRDRGSGRRNDRDRDWEKDRGKEKEKDIRSRDDNEKEGSEREKSGTWEMRESEKGIWDGKFDDTDNDRRRSKHKSVLSIGSESGGGWQTESKREASPFLSKLADNLGMTALSPSKEAGGEGDIRTGAAEETSTSWGPDTRDTSTGWPVPGDEDNTAGSSGWAMPGDENITSSVKRGLAATDPDYGKWIVPKAKPESEASQGYVPTYSSRKNDKDWTPDRSERSRDSGRDRPSRGRPRDDWVPPKTRDSSWSSHKNEDRKTDNRKWNDSKGNGNDKWRSKEKSSYPESGTAWKSESSQVQWTGPVECVDPAGDWAGVFTTTDSQPQETARPADPNGDRVESTDSKPQWTGPVECVDPAGDWASAELQIQEDGEPEPYEYIPWVPGVRGGGRGRYGRGRVRGPRVRKKKVRTIGLMRGFQDDPEEEEDNGEKPEGSTSEAANPEEPNPFWYLAEGEAPEDEAAKWGVAS